MQESSVYQHIIQQGERKNAIESLFAVLTIRFGENQVQRVKPTLEGIEDLQRLKQLLPTALQAQNLDAFKQTLETNE
jgi:hypothetical protein